MFRKNVNYLSLTITKLKPVVSPINGARFQFGSIMYISTGTYTPMMASKLE